MVLTPCGVWRDIGAVCGELLGTDEGRRTIVIITAYEPDPEFWDETYT